MLHFIFIWHHLFLSFSLYRNPISKICCLCISHGLGQLGRLGQLGQLGLAQTSWAQNYELGRVANHIEQLMRKCHMAIQNYCILRTLCVVSVLVFVSCQCQCYVPIQTG